MNNIKMAEFILEMLKFWNDFDCSNGLCNDCIFKDSCESLNKLKNKIEDDLKNINDD